MQFNARIIWIFLLGCVTVVQSRSYSVIIMTGSSDTSSRVELRFVGDIGKSSAHILTPRGGTFKRLSKYMFRGLNDRDVGALNGVEIYLHPGSSSSWPIKKVLVVSDGHYYVFLNYERNIYPSKWTYIRANCPTGFKKALDGSCVDDNECNLANGGCHHFCNNNVGSYKCSCRDGFELYNKLKCQDIDECARNTDGCDDQSTNCYNYHGGYECRCKKGFKYIPNNRRKCERTTCYALPALQGTLVSPSKCLVSKGPTVGDKCTVSCKPGYVLPNPSRTTVTCLDSGNWDVSPTYCNPITCPRLTPPANGYVFPPLCSTTGNTFGQSCYYRCNKGYTLKNGQKSQRDCTSSGAWNITTPAICVKVFIKPWISCPSDVRITLAPNASHADVTALLSKPRSNVDDVKIFPEKYRTSLVFPAGINTLTYKATNKNGDVAQCTTDVDIEDKESPKVVYCPPNIYEIVNGQSKQVSWTVPKFSDNVGVTKVTSTHNPGDTFKVDSWVVYYTASDAAGNRVTCNFDVNVKKAECRAPPSPDGGTITVSEFGGYKYATIKCNPGKKVFISTWGIKCNKNTLKWDPIPDCVDSKPMPSSGICDQGYVNQTGVNIIHNKKVCVKCPRGYKYDDVKKNCTKCPKGKYSGSESSLSCTPCPLHQGTLTDGGKVCLDKCSPGQESADGFTSCKLCRKGFYEDRYGSTACKACPSGHSTFIIGARRLSDCGVRPNITEFVAQPNNVTEGNQVDIICKGSGVPVPTFSIKKIKPAPDGFGGPVKKTMILDNSSQIIGLRHTITKVTQYDAGSYKCELQNKFGKTENYVALQVKLVLG